MKKIVFIIWFLAMITLLPAQINTIRDTVIEYTDSNATIFQYTANVKNWNDMEVFARDTFPCIMLVSQYSHRNGNDATVAHMEGYVEVWYEKVVLFRGDDFWFRQAHGPFTERTRYYMRNFKPMWHTPLVIWDTYIFDWVSNLENNYRYPPELIYKMHNIKKVDDSWKNNARYIKNLKVLTNAASSTKR